MAYSKDAIGKQRNRHNPTSHSDTYEREPRREASRHSLPHLAQQPEVQRPDGRRPKYASSQRSKPPEEFFVAHAMPSQSRMLTRSGTVSSRHRRTYDEDEEDEKERLRGRMQSRSTSRVKIRPITPRSASSDSSVESYTVPTPSRTSYMHHRSAPPSAPSPGSTTGSSSDDADSDDSEDYRQTRALKERMNVKSRPGTPESEPARTPAASRSRSRRRPLKQLVHEAGSLSDASSEHAAPPQPRVVLKGSSRSQRKNTHQSRASSVAPRQQSRHRGRHREVHTTYSPKRSQNRYT
ncbi:hypothetical protein F5Y17DRAFT_378745 [Xylariaceae sp. FL0594]|nr:hypothetical protein F5Y17DRAFT_378745 [Xylariaceae sp. FL0594]